MTKRRVVVTGLGALAPNGNNVPEFWEALCAGQSGIDYITCFDTEGFPVRFAGELKNIDLEDHLDRRELRKLDRFSALALIASREAFQHAEIDWDRIDRDRVGVILGTGVGGIQTLESQHTQMIERGPRRVSPHFVPKMIANIAAGQISIHWGLRGPNQTVTSACASATDAIGIAMRLIQFGDADMIIAGGTETSITPMTVAGFANMKALSTRNDDPPRASRPFDRDRDGFVLGEGAGILVLETEEHAHRRGARILAELAGYGATDDAFHVTQPAPNGAGAALAMRLAIRNAGLEPRDVDYINAHGTSTPYNDKNETEAIKEVFGEHARRLKVSSTKSMTGHLLGASGAIEAVATIKVIEQNIIPPTINYTTPDPECDLDYVPNQAQTHPVDTALSNTFGFGGHNAVILLRRWNA
jgi:3-oxoacyl-[acyl-carrier-protein] synthase II